MHVSVDDMHTTDTPDRGAEKKPCVQLVLLRVQHLRVHAPRAILNYLQWGF